MPRHWVQVSTGIDPAVPRPVSGAFRQRYCMQVRLVPGEFHAVRLSGRTTLPQAADQSP